MKKTLIALSLFSAVFMSSAYAEGCLKGAAVGGVAGHFVGRHPIIGAGVGCLVGQHVAKKNREKEAVAVNQNQTSNMMNQTNNPNGQQKSYNQFK